MITAQLIAPLYFPGVEFMMRVFTTSTGDTTTVVQKPAAKPAVKWHGMLSVGNKTFSYKGEPEKMLRTRFDEFALTCHHVVLQDVVLNDVVRHQLRAVHDGIASYVCQTTWALNIMSQMYNSVHLLCFCCCCFYQVFIFFTSSLSWICNEILLFMIIIIIIITKKI